VDEPTGVGTHAALSRSFDPVRLPKAELHVHLEGTLEPELLRTLAERNKLEIPHAQKAYEFTDAATFFRRYFDNTRVLLTELDFYDLTMAYLRKAKANNVRHVELSFEPQMHAERGVALTVAIEGIWNALRDGRNALGVSSHLIMLLRGDRSVADAAQTLQAALPYRSRIVAIGLHSSQTGSLAAFQIVFERARAEGFLTVAHAGEFGPASQVREALDLLKVARIDHGIHAMDDPTLVSRLHRQTYPMTVCPLSDARLGAVDSLRVHPLKRMLAAGLNVSLGSDYPAYVGGYLSDTYRQTADALNLTAAELVTLARNSFTTAFIDDATRERFHEELAAVAASS